MSIRLRRYKRRVDFDKIGQFLYETYQPENRHSNWLQPRWEYMHYHPDLDESALNKIGIWETDGNIVGVAHYELALGEVYFEVHPDFTHLKQEMLEYAEDHLNIETDDGHRYIKIYVNDFDTELEAIVKGWGYQMVMETADCWSAFNISNPFPEISLPTGFQLKSLQDDNDLRKLNRVIYRGFNHSGEPPEAGIKGMERMQSAPNYRKDLNIIVQAPNGRYASYCGMWYEARNKIAYVEPVCTDPDYHRLGLGTAAVLEGIRRCGTEGATVAFVGSQQPFYISMGFEKLFDIHLWTNKPTK
jgi:GNAT superfamily N-acetyltransferase